jgi:hypothetical protein
MNRNAVLGAVLLSTALTTGCVDRKFIITSEPTNAAVYRNGVYIGQTPVDEPFVYYGKYEFRIVKDGFETIVDLKRIAAPWYAYPPADLISENFVPVHLRDTRRINYTLQERVPAREFDVLERAKTLRERGRQIGAPSVDGDMPPSATPGAVPPAVPPPPVPFPSSPGAPPAAPGAVPAVPLR